MAVPTVLRDLTTAPQGRQTALRWGPLRASLTSNDEAVLDWARACLHHDMDLAAGPAPDGDVGRVLVDYGLARTMADACDDPARDVDGVPVRAGTFDGIPVTTVEARAWPAPLVLARPGPGAWWAVTGRGALAPRAGEVLARQLLERRLRECSAVPLHASSVAFDGRAVLFIGDAGRGKTTLATWSAARLGGALLSGDRTAICPGGGSAPVAVGCAQSTRYRWGTLDALVGRERMLRYLPGRHRMLGDWPAPGSADLPPKVVLNNAELAWLGVSVAASARLGAVALLAEPITGGPVVERVAPHEALPLLAPHVREPWLILPGAPADTVQAAARHLGDTLGGGPVLRVRWRPGLDNPEEVVGRIRELAGR
jgi:hypothetical protein